MSKSSERYSPEEAIKEASQMREKIKSGEAKTYEDAEKLIDEQRKKSDFFAGLDDRQRGDILRFFLEQHDQKNSPKKFQKKNRSIIREKILLR